MTFGTDHDILLECRDKLDLLLSLFHAQIALENAMSQELDNLQAQVQKNTDAEQSAITLLTKLSDMIKQSVNDPAALTKLSNDLKSSSDALAAAILANTPASPSP